MRALPLVLLFWRAMIAAHGADATQVEIDIAQPAGRISPLLYGQFLEFMFGGIKGGLHAEMLRNRSFEEPADLTGMPRSWERYPDSRNDDYGLRVESTAGEKAPGSPPGESRSLHLKAIPGVIARHGVFQARVPITRRACDFSMWVKCLRAGKVSVSLERDAPDGEIYIQSSVQVEAGDWKAYRLTLSPFRMDRLARLVILAEAPFEGHIDQVSLMPADNADGVRPDVFAKIADLHPAFVRWPGGNVAQDYHWMWGIGPRESRITWTNFSWNNELESSDFGTPEFVQFCRRLKAAPSITVNVEGRGASAEEAAAWVEYCNGSSDTKYGRLRASHGYREPLGVRYWEVGNEIWGDWVTAHSDARAYSTNLLRYAARMRQADPEIKIIAVGDNDMSWNKSVLSAAGREIDLLSIHHYYTWKEAASNLVTLLDRPRAFEREYAEVEGLFKEHVPGRTLQLAINEWGLDLPERLQYSIATALYAGKMFNMLQRSAALVEMSAVSDLVNGWPGGLIQVERDGLFLSPIYLVNALYAANTGSERLQVRLDRSEGMLDVAASRAPESGVIYVQMVNSDLSRALPVTLTFQGNVDLEEEAGCSIVQSESLEAFNSFAAPDNVRIRTTAVDVDRSFTVELPRHSVSVYRIRTRRAQK